MRADFASSPFLHSRSGTSHELLIVGWEGNCWLGVPAFGNDLIKIPFGMYGVEHMCVAPKSKFDQIAWQ